jgi:1-acyl-sn-glycerol-3-phosphate acyltransferase
MRKSSLYLVWLFIRTIIAYILTAFVGLFVFLPCLILAGILPERLRFRSRLLFTLISWAARLTVRTMFVSVRVQGREYIPQEPVIFVANHESALDIPLLTSIIGVRPHLWYAYWVFFNTPILGFFLRRMSVPVYSEHPTRAARAIVQGMCLARTYNLDSLMFPEGGRYVDGKVHTFFAGFAMIAKKLGLRVVPVMIRNTGKVYPPYSFLLYPHPVDVEIGTPFAREEQETSEEFTSRVYQWFVDRN